ncbi:DNA-binding response regulator [Kyrpidia spormannii]|uniref:DNA-binding response regulator n=1 Tax=Kyrpidia spormannii TaxID=2055160 RepID=A0A2K8NAL9_9BACL|nr:response regulator transcription factor [Kyrpidia spormannii]ATY85660.1 DNA-binding response regulator [Kyrpidia spormannii]
MERILVVDDEEAILAVLQFHLEKAGYVAETATHPEEVFQRLREGEPVDLIILDHMLPDMSGLDICKILRQEGITIPIIFLTALDDEVERVLCLEMGADDYITKPFRPRELAARIRAVLRRYQLSGNGERRTADVLHAGPVIIDLAKHTVTVFGQEVSLTLKEFQLLHHLAEHADKVVTRDTLLDHIWGFKYTGDTRVVDVHISHLRNKIEPNPASPQLIKTVRGVGYKLITGRAMPGDDPEEDE